MGILSWIVLGAIAGFLANMVMGDPGPVRLAGPRQEPDFLTTLIARSGR